jgi:hypothetical protein
MLPRRTTERLPDFQEADELLNTKSDVGERQIDLMPSPKQANPLDAMVARLEEANARAYEQFEDEDERVFRSDHDARPPSDQQKLHPVVPGRWSWRGRGLIGLLLVMSVCVAGFAWPSSYGAAAKLIIARWANASLPQPAPRTSSQDVASAAAPMSPELANRLEAMARDLANMMQQMEQLKTSQEQMIRGNTAVAEQLRASQEQLAAVAWFWAVGSARKPLRRKPATTLPSPQPQSQVPANLLPKQP